MAGELVPFSRGHDLEVLALETRIVTAAAGDWFSLVDELRYLLAFKAPDIIARVLALVAPRLGDGVLVGIRDALTLGASFALGLGIAQDHAPALRAGGIDTRLVPVRIIGPTEGLTASAALAIGQSQDLARVGAPAELVLAPIFKQKNHADMVLKGAVTMAANAGVSSAANAMGVKLVWVAERDACLHCLGLQGSVVSPGSAFDYRRTYAATPLSRPPAGLQYPPRHPYCRCTVEPLFDRSYADALGREADRSVLRGFSLPSESNKARVDAAQRLISDGVTAPKSVVGYAQAAVKRGRFNRRDVPTGN